MPKEPKSKSITPEKPGDAIYQLKITLREVKPTIWRRVQVKSDITLLAFHKIIQKVMGWTDSHLHEFIVKGVSYGDSEDEDALNERKYRLNKLRLEEKEKFFYVYDFGDNWEHVILVEKILPVDSNADYPVCIKGKGACPPEDCGGTTDYSKLVEVISDPYHDDYEDTLDWVGLDFDPEIFDIEKVNRKLRGRSR